MKHLLAAFFILALITACTEKQNPQIDSEEVTMLKEKIGKFVPVEIKYDETLFGGLGKFHLNQEKGKALQMHLGLGYRTSGSFIPTAAVQYNDWYVGFNLDIDKTGFNNSLNTSRGAYEMHIRYIIKNVKPFKFKNCMIL